MKLQEKIVLIIYLGLFLITATTGILHQPLEEAGIYNYVHVPFAYLLAFFGLIHIIRFRKVIINIFKK